LRAIHDKIQRNWTQPLSARPGLECVINVTQIPSGDVVGVSFGACNGDDAVKRSIEAAVQRASPLPRPPVQSLFNRSLEVTFKPEV
jgi:colicin import membrane protein